MVLSARLRRLVCDARSTATGTNKYDTAESKFDQKRLAEMRKINNDLKSIIGPVHEKRMVLFGDLNFRVEVLDSQVPTAPLCDCGSSERVVRPQNDKSKGGHDFQATEQVRAAAPAPELTDAAAHSHRVSHQILRSKNMSAIRELFLGYDRLNRLLKDYRQVFSTLQTPEATCGLKGWLRVDAAGRERADAAEWNHGRAQPSV
jgi:hypothetical protein